MSTAAVFESRGVRVPRLPRRLVHPLTFLILPNLPFLVLSLEICYQRPLGIVAHFSVGLIAPFVGLWAAAALIGAAMTIDIVWGISKLFCLKPYDVLDAVQYADQLDMFASPAYLGAGAVLGGILLAQLWLIHNYRAEMKSTRTIWSMAMMFAVMFIDMRVNQVGYEWQKFSGDGYDSPFESAQMHARNNTTFIAGGQPDRVLMVMMEGMGAFADPRQTALLYDMLDTPAVQARYDLTSGTSGFVGSTTGAESRELCGRWGSHTDILADRPDDCLPSQLAAQGWDMHAYHAFSGAFFNREMWYPAIGFTHIEFKEQLIERGGRLAEERCGLTFNGLCDLRVADVVEDALKTGKGKRFVYWLTLNTHMPFLPDQGTARYDCGGQADPFADRVVCDMTEMFADVLERIATMATAPDMPPLEVLIVGDHNPPLWTRAGRNIFTPNHVQWFHLRPRGT